MNAWLGTPVCGVPKWIEEEGDVVMLGGILDLKHHLCVRVERLGLLVPEDENVEMMSAI